MKYPFLNSNEHISDGVLPLMSIGTPSHSPQPLLQLVPAHPGSGPWFSTDATSFDNLLASSIREY